MSNLAAWTDSTADPGSTRAHRVAVRTSTRSHEPDRYDVYRTRQRSVRGRNRSGLDWTRGGAGGRRARSSTDRTKPGPGRPARLARVAGGAWYLAVARPSRDTPAP